ncbi:glycosyltransferase family 2 protein [Conexibacter sp. SYSU D00693]|uniref:glycosyltransferase family 2 protein n=1 Tax=Conexibacter sp. SYSU D00693 TaxID=2812560 RepID=UPI00196A6F15|nr:glycosyltransferase [Conexibacter sp. SYSU D00693]
MPPVASVVFATHNRAERLRALLRSLEEQTVPTDQFEVVVVDDGSSDHTAEVLADAEARGVLQLTAIRLQPGRGPAVARNAGWRAASTPFVAFTDDDCVATPVWLEAGLRAWDGDAERVVQGRTDPIPSELDREGPFTRTLRVRSLGPFFQTCNVMYPRALLERVGGFDEETFSVPGGEDCDLARRCFDTGAHAVFADDARVQHAVHELGPVAKLKVAWRWSETMRLYARHPAMRETLTYKVFWKKSHYLLVRALIGLVLPKRMRLLRAWCLAPIAPAYLERAQVEGQGKVWSAPYFLVHDAVELAAAVRGGVRYRTWVV